MPYSLTYVFTTKPHSALSWCIRTVTKRKFSHVSMELHLPEFDRDMLFQATWPYVAVTNTKLFYAKETIVDTITIPISDDEMRTVMQIALDNTGKTYATMKLLGIAYRKLMGAFGYNVKNPAADGDKTEECAELGALVLIALRVPPSDDREAVDPGWVYDRAYELQKERLPRAKMGD